MAIIQISKIQQRAGDLVDLPQLDEAEFGFASDARRLFIGRTTDGSENIEVLTSYSNISFSQVLGTQDANIDISANVSEGQILAYNSINNTWENRGGNSAGVVNLGDVNNIKIANGAIGYVLATDGIGNLYWTAQGALYTPIISLSNDTPIQMVVANTTPYANKTKITITGVQGGNADSIVNGIDFYVKLDVDFPNNGLVELYTDINLSNANAAVGTNLNADPNTGVATTLTGTAGSGTSGAAQGPFNSVQYNNGGILAGDSSFTYNAGLVTAVRFAASTTSAAPFTVSSNIQVANLHSAFAGVVTTNAQPNITSLGTLSFLNVNGNIVAANITANTGIFTGNGAGLTNLNGSNVVGAVSNALHSTTANTVTTNAQPNITSVGTLTSLAVTGNVSAGNISATNGTFTSVIGNGSSLTALNASNLSTGTVPSARLTGNYNISVTSANTAGTVTTNAQPNITSVGTLTQLNVTGNTTTGGIKTDNYYYANGLAISFAGTYSNSNVANYLPTYTGTVGATAITTGANTTAGTITGNWTLTAGSRLQSTYADLAEYYAADKHYPAGTVLDFGGEFEVTLAGIESNKIAGVVSADPAYVMNGMIHCNHPIAIALQGRVPCKVKGKVSKGDMMISAGDGFAKATIATPKMGTVIGKALQNFDGEEGVIEVVVGRL
jgi:hypothetical protein